MNDNESVINLEYVNPYFVLKNLLRLIWIPILAFVSIYLLISSLVIMRYKPVYRSSAILVVNSKSTTATSSNNTLNVTLEMTQVFAEVFQSDVLKNKVAEDMGTDKMPGTISTEVIPETNLIKISVDDTSPEVAFNTLDLVLKHYSEVSDYIFDNAVVEVIKSPSVPTSPNNAPMSGKKKIIFSALGAILAAGAIVIFTFLDDTIQTVSAAKDKIDGDLYSVIPYEKKASVKDGKVSILITNPGSSRKYIETFRSLATMIDHRMKRTHSKVIMVSSSAENEGKSTVAANLALSLTYRENKVLLVDCDFKKPSVHKIFDKQDEIEEDFSEYLLSDSHEPYNVSHFHALDLAMSSKGTTSVKLVHSERLGEFLESMRSKYDYIIIDSAPMMIISDTEAMVKVCDSYLLVVRQAYVPVGAINSCIDAITEDSDKNVGYVLNYYRKLGNKNEEKHNASHRASKKASS